MRLPFRRAEYLRPALVGRSVIIQKTTEWPTGGMDIDLTVGEVIHEDSSGVIVDAFADGMRSRAIGQKSVAYPFEFVFQEEVEDKIEDQE